MELAFLGEDVFARIVFPIEPNSLEPIRVGFRDLVQDKIKITSRRLIDRAVLRFQVEDIL